MAELTSRYVVYRKLEEKIRTIVAGEVNPERVYLAAVPVPDSNDDRCVQIIPGSVLDLHPVSGAGSLRQEDFVVAVWVRLWQDWDHRDSKRIADGSHGILRVHELIEGKPARPGLVNETLNSLLQGVIMWISSQAPVLDPGMSGWVRQDVTYRLLWEQDEHRTPH